MSASGSSGRGSSLDSGTGPFCFFFEGRHITQLPDHNAAGRCLDKSAEATEDEVKALRGSRVSVLVAGWMSLGRPPLCRARYPEPWSRISPTLTEP